MLPSAGLGEVTIFGVYGGLKLSVVLFNAKLAVELFWNPQTASADSLKPEKFEFY